MKLSGSAPLVPQRANCPMSANPPIVDSDSKPEHIHMPTLSATPMPPSSETPGRRMGSNGSKCQFARPITARLTNGTGTTICRATSSHEATRRPRMLLEAKIEKSTTATAQRVQALKPNQVCMESTVRAMYTAESTKMESTHHQPVWKPMNSPLARRDQRYRPPSSGIAEPSSAQAKACGRPQRNGRMMRRSRAKPGPDPETMASMMRMAHPSSAAC